MKTLFKALLCRSIKALLLRLYNGSFFFFSSQMRTVGLRSRRPARPLCGGGTPSLITLHGSPLVRSNNYRRVALLRLHFKALLRLCYCGGIRL